MKNPGNQIFSREHIGSTARIVQRVEATFPGVTCDNSLIILVERGEKHIEMGGKKLRIAAGEAVAIAAGQTLDVRNIKPVVSDDANESNESNEANDAYEAVWLAWDARLSQEFIHTLPETDLRQLQPITALSLQHLPEVFYSAIQRGIAAIADPEDYPKAVADHLMMEVLIWLRLKGFYFADHKNISLSAQVRKRIVQKPAAKWLAPDMAADLSMSEATLRRHLAAEGNSFNAILIDVKMMHALTLLQSTDMPVTQIAFDAGYESTSRFTARFKKRFNCLPTEIRKSLK